jgi:hypothetical protein
MGHLRRGRRCVLVGGAIAALCLSVVANASGSRLPTRAEQRGITRAAEGSPHATSGKVYVNEIRVSTVGPWAEATVTIFIDRAPDSATAVLHKVRGVWRLTKHSPGTAGEWCGIGMPPKDQLNLGFSPRYCMSAAHPVT